MVSRPVDSPELQAMVRSVIDSNRYMALGTTEPDEPPRLSPVYFTHHEHHDCYWVSAPEAHHSENLVRQPGIAIVTFDSSVDPGSTQAMSGCFGSASVAVPCVEHGPPSQLLERRRSRSARRGHARPRTLRVGVAFAEEKPRAHRTLPLHLDRTARLAVPSACLLMRRASI
jgi:hypothetical protein